MFSLAARLSEVVAPIRRGMTLGVRGACFDNDGRVFLVRHTYRPGWYLPGGGVERGEAAPTALERELREEGGIVAIAAPELFGVYWNTRRARDHVLLYVLRDVAQAEPLPYPNREIAEAGFFAIDALPDITPATARRLEEIAGSGRSATW